jgi:hypothetical protein
VTEAIAPTLSAVRKQGVYFANSHALFPTFTTPNASAIATGHYLADTGDFSNSPYIGFPVFADGNFTSQTSRSVTPFIEDDQVLGDLDAHFGGSFLGAQTLLEVARARGYATAVVGKAGPVALQDIGELDPRAGHLEAGATIVIDDYTGTPNGIPLSAPVLAALAEQGLPSQTPARHQPAGDLLTAGTLETNHVQQQYFVDATTRVVLPLLRREGKPFVLIYWSRDPDGTQHNQGDSLNRLTPGINGPTSHGAITNADANLRQILAYIDADPDLATNTDLFVTADHGFATISRHELDARGAVAGGYSTRFNYRDRKGRAEVSPGFLPPGFLALDLAHELALPLFDPDTLIERAGVRSYAPVDPSIAAPTDATLQHPSRGDGLIGGTGGVLAPSDAKVIVSAGGGSDLIYVPDGDRATIERIVAFLTRQDYTDGIFVDSAFGKLPGALPLAALSLEGGSARLPHPTILVNFRSFLAQPHVPLSGVQIADTPLQEGQGMHGTLSRDNTFNFMAAMGPDFKQGWVDRVPAGNADIAVTLAHVLSLPLSSQGLAGRVLTEALRGGVEHVAFWRGRLASTATAGRRTVLLYQQAGTQRYLDAACFVVSATSGCPQQAY